MLNERKIRLMTKTAIYEQGKGKDDVKINNYSGSDYVRFNMLKTILCATIAAVLLFGLVVLYNVKGMMNDIMKVDFWALGRELLLAYLVFIAFYAVISFIVYQQRYHRAARRLRRYNLNLKKIASITRREAKNR